MLYGEGFPAFVAGFPPAGAIPYLADVARLENAWVEAYHAAEADALGLDALAAIAPDALGALRFRPHPAARLLRFSHPAASIWAALRRARASRARPRSGRPKRRWSRGPTPTSSCAFCRPAASPSPRRCFPAPSLGEAAALAAADGFDPGAHLVGLIEAGAFQSLILKELRP